MNIFSIDVIWLSGFEAEPVSITSAFELELFLFLPKDKFALFGRNDFS